MSAENQSKLLSDKVILCFLLKSLLIFAFQDANRLVIFSVWLFLTPLSVLREVLGLT